MRNKIDWYKVEKRWYQIGTALLVIGTGALLIRYVFWYFNGELKSCYLLNFLLTLSLIIVTLLNIFKMNKELEKNEKAKKRN